MKLRKALFFLCVLIALSCQIASFGLNGQWWGAAFALIPALGFVFAPKISAAWAPTASLAGLVCLAIAGVLLGAQGFVMIVGGTAGLAAWDLFNLDRTMATNQVTPTIQHFEARHVQSLFLALVSGLLLAGIGKLLSLQISFLVLLLLVAIELFSLYRVSRYIANS